MKFGIKCKVDSYTVIGHQPIEIEVDGTKFQLKPSEEGLLNEIIITVKVNETSKFISNIAEDNKAITINVDEIIKNDLIDMVQYLEASLSFSAEVKDVDWETAEYIFVPENEEEMRNIHITSFRVSNRAYLKKKKLLTADVFKSFVQNKNIYAQLTAVKMFYKEGIKEFEAFRYIQAYHNFYFVLEDLYGEGKTQNRQIEEKFKRSQVLREIVQSMIDNSIKGKHLEDIHKFLEEEKMKFDVDGIIELVVRVRGNLHHYTRKSTKRIGTPFNQKDFESMAFLLLGLSVHSIYQAIVQCNISSQEKM